MDLKEKDENKIFRYIYQLAKHLDDQLSHVTTIEEIFSSEFTQKRRKLVQKCEALMFLDYETFGKKTREILWRQGCYNSISKVKKLLRKTQQQLTIDEHQAVGKFLLATIEQYKKIVLKFERYFDLNLRYVIDMDAIGDGNTTLDDEIVMTTEEMASVESIDYAFKSIHFMLIALGDVHRYLCDFGVKELNGLKMSTFKISAAFYTEAFKLNPTIGMAQNQLGTLYMGKNYDIDSVFHYLFALSCRIPFDLSEDNIGKIFQRNIDYIETLDGKNDEDAGDDTDKICLKDFVARFFLNVDIFFYDKHVIDFNNLCHYNLIELKKLLSTRLNDVDENFLFKITSILFFCMSHLKHQDSSKIHNLNALMVALTSELTDACIKNVERCISDYKADDVQFQSQYNQMFDNYERRVTESRHKPPSEKTTNPSTQNSTQEKSVTNSTQDKLTQNSTQERENGINKTSRVVKKSSAKDRRRRKRIICTSDSEESDDMLSDFGSDDDADKENQRSDYSDRSHSESELSFSSSDEEDADASFDIKNLTIKSSPLASSSKENVDSDIDVIVEEEKMVFIEETENNKNEMDDVIIEEEQIIYNNNNLNIESPELSSTPPLKLKYLPKYNKIDPNIILRFAQHEKALKSLKLLFDWLRTNSTDILMKCHRSNPELIHKIIKLLNYLNIDIYTKKVLFDLKLIKTNGIRYDSITVFENRQSIPLSEDIALKSFDMFESNQSAFDWEINSKMKITKSEESLIRILKLVDFGFYLTKSNKFNYVFCKKQRAFVECGKGDPKGKRKRTRREEKRNGGIENQQSSARNGRGSRNENRRTRRLRRAMKHKATTVASIESSSLSKALMVRDNRSKGSEMDGIENGKNENNMQNSTPERNKYEIMGKLWLRNEVQHLENKARKPANANLTPYLVVDAKCLTEFTPIVKNLVKTKKFLVLIPNAVFSELDELKKYSEGARSIIRWLEQEFKRGNRFIRSQRDDETLPLPMIKIPKKLDRDSAVFLHIVQFCHHIVSNNNSSHDILTLITGEPVSQKKCSNFSFTGLIDSISVNTELITTFYAKYKKK